MPAERRLKALLKAFDIDCLWFVRACLKNQSSFDANKFRRMFQDKILESRSEKKQIRFNTGLFGSVLLLKEITLELNWC